MSKDNPLAKRKMFDPCPDCKGQGDDSLLAICQTCDGSGALAIVCRACWNKKEPWRFRKTRGAGFGKTCKDCRERNRSGKKKDTRRGLPDKGPLRVKLNVLSGNTKTGRMPVSMSSSPTCPTSCVHRGGACYAESHFVGMHWRRLSSGGEGMTWDRFCQMISKLPDDRVWRHNEAGDLPGQGDAIDVALLRQLVEANNNRPGFTYTHKEVFADDAMAVANRLAIAESNRDGFTINLSADTLEHADALLKLGIGPVAVTLPEYAPQKMETPGGKPVIVCPAQWSKATCQDCQLCAKPNRKVIIGFWAHGPGKGEICSTFQLPLFG